MLVNIVSGETYMKTKQESGQQKSNQKMKKKKNIEQKDK